MIMRRKLDNGNRIVIPKAMLKKLNIPEHSSLDISLEGSKIIITDPQKKCELCGAKKNLLDEINICVKCAEKISVALDKKRHEK